MAKYTSDTDLIRGAATAYKDWSNVPGMYKGLDAIVQQGTKMADEAFKNRKELEDKLDKSVDDILGKSSSLGKNYHDYVYGKTKDYKSNYLKALRNKDKKAQTDANFLLQDLAIEVKEVNEIGLDYAQDRIDGNLSSAMFKEGETSGILLEKMLAKDYTVGENEEGERVFVMDVDGEKHELTKHEYANLTMPKHFETGAVYGKQFNINLRQSEWNKFTFEEAIHESLPENKKEFKAAMADEFWMGNSFEDILKTGLVEQELVKEGFGDGDGKISPEELANFMDAITNPENDNFKIDVSRKIMTEKLNAFAEGEYNKHWDKIKNERNKKQQQSRNRSGSSSVMMVNNRQYTPQSFERTFRPLINFIENPKEGQTFDSPSGYNYKFEGGKYKQLKTEGWSEVPGDIIARNDFISQYVTVPKTPEPFKADLSFMDFRPDTDNDGIPDVIDNDPNKSNKAK